MSLVDHFRRIGVLPTLAACPLRSEGGHARTHRDMPHNGGPPDRGVVPMFCRKPRLKGPGGVRGGRVSWENFRNLLKRNGPIWHQLGQYPREINVAPGTHAPQQKTMLIPSPRRQRPAAWPAR